ncbi:MAG TPA: biopolymer transporter ExbD [Methylophilaceae bacterium]|nr:biopolymer transporter ExbD [Methylophilaceae bacterium]
MSEGVKEENQLYDEINITPMLDLAYVLLVIFIIMTTASVQGVKVDIPQTQATASLAKPQMRAITITSDGTVYLDAYPVDMPMLEQRLAEYKGGNPDLPVVLKGDAAAHYEKVSEVLEICKRLGITEIGLVTKRDEG